MPSYLKGVPRKSEAERFCNIVGRSGLCELVCTHVTVGEFAFWNNPTDQIGGRPWKEGGGPFSKLLSSGDTSTNSLSHPILGENSVGVFVNGLADVRTTLCALAPERGSQEKI